MPAKGTAQATLGTQATLNRARAKIIVALDVPTAARTRSLVRSLRGRAGMVKIGYQLFTREGPSLVRTLVHSGERVFLDLKLHDIPHIVAEGCLNAAAMGASLLTVHAAGGPKMLRAARRALDTVPARRRPKLLAVTLLTSLDAASVTAVGFTGGVRKSVLRLARLAKKNGCDGVIAAPTDVRAIRRACGDGFLIVTPGIRAVGGRKASDQARVATAPEAVKAGADYIVVGRAITAERNRAAALERMAAAVAGVLD